MFSLARLLSLFVLATMLLTSGCHRPMQLDDTKGPHSGKAVKSLGGKNGPSRQVSSEEEFGWTYDQEAYSSQGALDAGNAQGDQYLNPGENGIPSYAHFRAINESEAKLFQKVFFDTNDDVIRGKTNFERVEQVTQFLKNNPRVLIFIEGHCDERGAATYNLSLGSRRANSVRNLLIEQGIDATRLFTITFGSERPAVLGHDESAWKWNRRIEYKIFER